MNRLIVKANYASLKIPSLEFEIPPDTQKGSINTLEGFIEMSISELEQDQPTRRVRNDTVLREREREERYCLNYKDWIAYYTSLYFHCETLSKQCWELLLRVAMPTFANTFIFLS